MPEPVVIIGPAGGPAGPNSGHAATPETATAPESETANPEEGAAAPAARGAVVLGGIKRIVRLILSIAKPVVWGFLRVVALCIRKYPRHSLAAGASLVILGGILYSQSGSRTTRRDLTNAIKGTGSPQADAAPKSPRADAGTKVAGGPTPGEGSGKEKTNASDPASPPKLEKADPVVVQADPTSQPSPPAPKPESTEPPLASATSVAQAPAPEKDGQKLEPASAPGSSGSEPGLAPLPATVGEAAKATLLAGPASTPEPGGMPPAPSSTVVNDKKEGDVAVTVASPSDKAAAPVPAAVAPVPLPSTPGDKIAKTESMPEVPGDLLLPETAPKAGEEKGKEPKPGETSPLPISVSESKPVEEPKKIDVPTPLPIDAAARPAGESGASRHFSRVPNQPLSWAQVNARAGQ